VNVYWCHFNHKYKSLFHADVSELDRAVFCPAGQSMAEGWRPFSFRDERPEEEGYAGLLPWGDFVGLGKGIGLTAVAMQRVGDVLRACGELLPVTYEADSGGRDTFHWFRCLTVIDARDDSKTIGKRYSDNPVSYVRIDRYAFFADRIGDALLFHLPQGTTLFCTEAFKKLIDDSGLVGLSFQLRWSDEPEGARRLMEWEKAGGLLLPPMEVATG
jgi:hypothetical protein